jgi:hypothetical protein
MVRVVITTINMVLKTKIQVQVIQVWSLQSLLILNHHYYIQVNIINFDNATNLTNNPNDSVYGQIEASSENNVNIVWQDSVPGPTGRNYDIFFKRSSDAGTSFGKEINLSNNNGFSEHPQLATSGNNVYVVWADNSFSANREILFARSTDGGSTFGDPKNLSNDKGDSYNQEIFAFEDSVMSFGWTKKIPMTVKILTVESYSNPAQMVV